MKKNNQPSTILKSVQISLWLCFFLATFYFLFVSFKYPFIGLHVEKDIKEQWVITSVEEDSWADTYEIKAGSKVITINGNSPDEFPILKRFHAIEQADSFTLQNGNERITYHNLSGNVVNHWVFFLLFPFIFLILTIVITILIYKKRKYEQSGRILVLFLLALSTNYFSLIAETRADLFSILLGSFAFLIWPGLFIHFLHLYSLQIRMKWFSNKIYKWMYILAVLISIIHTYFVINWQNPQWFYLLRVAVFIVFITIAISIMSIGYSRFRKTKYGPTLKILVLGLVISFFPVTFLHLLPKLLFHASILSFSVATAFIVFLPLVFIYLFTAERLLDIDFIVSQVRYYAMITLLPAIILIILLALLFKIDGSLLKMIQLYLGIQTFLIVFLYIKSIVDFRLQNKFFATKYDYQPSLHRLSQAFKKEKNVVSLLSLIKEEVIGVLGVNRIHLFSKKINSGTFCVNKHVPKELLKAIDKYIQENTVEVGTIINIEYGFAVMLGNSTQKLTILWFSEKLNRTALNQDEITYLQTLAHNTNMALENIEIIENLYEQLRNIREDKIDHYPSWVSRLLINLSEQQRKELAIDIHDTLLQEQLYLYRKMDDMINHIDSDKPFQKELKDFQELLLDNIQLIRETCYELRPPLLEQVGLIDSLNNLIDQFQLRSNFTVHFNDSHFKIQLNDEYVLAIYRIFQELLTNAMKHSNATDVYLKLENNQDTVILLYEDNGVGLSKEWVEPTHSHMGLAGIEQRVNGLQGIMEMSSEPGLHVRITFLDVKEVRK